jgi:hypothetical protein
VEVHSARVTSTCNVKPVPPAQFTPALIAMPRFALFLATVTGVLAFGAPVAERVRGGNPPNSFGPGSTGKVRFSHERLRTVECASARAKDQLICRSEHAQMDSATTLVLHPIASAGPSPKDKRMRVTVAFGNRMGRQERARDLGAGKWEIEWDGYSRRPRFRVAGGDDFEITLRTLKGTCAKSGRECVLDTAATKKDCAIPEAHRRFQ